MRLNQKYLVGKIPSITYLATTTTALTAVGKRITNVSNFVKKTDYNTKISDIENKITNDHDQYITTQEFNKPTAEILLQESNKQMQQAKIILRIS